MSCSAVSSERVLSLGVVVENSVGDDVGDGVAGVVVGGFGAIVWSSSLSYFSMIVVVDSDAVLVLLMLGDGI